MADSLEAAGEAWMRGDLSSRAYFEMARRQTVPSARAASWWARLACAVRGWRRDG